MNPAAVPIDYFPMSTRDLDAVAALENEVQLFPWSRGNFADALAAGYSVWVCRTGAELIGFSVIMVVLDEAHLLNIAIARRVQGCGLGARLLRQSMAVAVSHGASRLLLEVRLSNTRAIALYRHFGFREIGYRRGYYPALDGREDALVLERSLER